MVSKGFCQPSRGSVTKSGVKKIEVPGASKALILEEDLRIGVEEGEEEYMFAFLRSVQVDNDENIYVLDAEYIKVRVYDKLGKHIRSFGKKGQGPGEFGWPARMIITTDEKLAMLDSMNKRFSYYSKEGECLQEINLGKQGYVHRAWLDSQGNIYGDIFEFTGNSSKMVLTKFDADFNRISKIAEMEREIKMGEINPISYRIVYNVLPDDRVFWANNLEYCIHVVNSSGNLIKKIYKDYNPISISNADKERIKKEFSGSDFPSSLKLVFPKKYPAMNYIISDSNGKIFVRTYTQNEDSLFKWDVFDEEGRYILSFFHPEEDILYTFRKGKVYSLNVDNEERIPHIRRYKIVWN